MAKQNASQNADNMSTYRVYFRDATHIVGRHDFAADDDQAAVTIGEVLCDACSDSCDAFEVWNGNHCIVGRTSRSPRAADVIMGRSQETIVKCEEAIQRSEWIVARSKKLLERLDELQTSDPPRSREYS